jgi:hypothetical protein
MPEFKLKNPEDGEVYVAGSPGERALLVSRGYEEVGKSYPKPPKPLNDEPQEPPKDTSPQTRNAGK